MRLRYALPIVFIVATGLLTTEARAASPTPEVEADYAKALVFWNVTKPPQCLSVSLVMAPTDPYGEGATARATEPKPGEVEVSCVITVFEDRWALESTCMKEMVLRHETGHNMGEEHSTDPASIMAPKIDPAIWCHEYPPPPAVTTPLPPPATSPQVDYSARASRQEKHFRAQYTRRCRHMERGSTERQRCFRRMNRMANFIW